MRVQFGQKCFERLKVFERKPEFSFMTFLCMALYLKTKLVILIT